MEPSNNCYDLIEKFEGLNLNSYPDPGTNGKPYTIGYGTTLINGQPFGLGLTITQ